MRFLLLIPLTFLFPGCQGQQVVSSAFDELQQQISNNHYPKIDAVLLEHNGRVVFEHYFNGFNNTRQHDLRSSFKSITSLLAGIAIDKKIIKLSDTLGRFYPELNDPAKRKISVQNLLEMRSGLNCEEMYEIGPECETEMSNTDDWIAFCLAVPLVRKPGVNWSYNSNEPMLVGDIIARASGSSIMEFARKYLFDPLEITNFKWTVSPKGQGMTAGSFYMLPIDMLKIINLVKNQGKFKNNQIVSADWIKQSTDCKIVIDFSFTRYSRFAPASYSSARYGFFWYKERLKYEQIDTDVLFSSGNGGQYMIWVPEYNLTAVFTGSNYGNWRGKLPFEIMLKYILPALSETSNRRP